MLQQALLCSQVPLATLPSKFSGAAGQSPGEELDAVTLIPSLSRLPSPPPFPPGLPILAKMERLMAEMTRMARGRESMMAKMAPKARKTEDHDEREGRNMMAGMDHDAASVRACRPVVAFLQARRPVAGSCPKCRHAGRSLAAARNVVEGGGLCQPTAVSPRLPAHGRRAKGRSSACTNVRPSPDSLRLRRCCCPRRREKKAATAAPGRAVAAHPRPGG